MAGNVLAAVPKEGTVPAEGDVVCLPSCFQTND